MADVGERPARLDPDVDVDPAAAGGLREADVAELAEQHARLGGDAHGVGEVRARLRVEVEAQLVGMVDVVAADRPRVERDRAHLRGPADDRELGRADLVGVAARRELDPRGLHVVRRPRGIRFWKKASPPPFSRVDRTMPGCTPFGQRSSVVGRRASARMIPSSTDEVVLDDVELRDRGRALGGREDHAIGFDTRSSRPPASTIVASDAAMPRSSTGRRSPSGSPRRRRRCRWLTPNVASTPATTQRDRALASRAGRLVGEHVDDRRRREQQRDDAERDLRRAVERELAAQQPHALAELGELDDLRELEAP